MVSVNVRMDNEVRDEFKDMCESIGMSMSGVFNVFVKKVLKEKKMPYDIVNEVDPFYSAENMERLKRGVIAANTKNNMHYHDIIEV